MPEIRIPPLDRAVRWSRDGDSYFGEVELADEHGEVARLTGRVSRSRALALMDHLRAQLARQAPAGVNVGAWANVNGPSQADLHAYILGEELRRDLAEQVQRRGWLAKPPWFGPWDVDVVTRAYRLIVAAQAGDPFATRQLGSIRAAALDGSPPAREALAKFQAVGRIIARGMTLQAMLAAMGASEDDLGVVEAGVMRGGGGRAPTGMTRARVVRPSRAATMARPMTQAVPVRQMPLARITPLRVAVPAPAPFVMPTLTPGAAPLAQPYPYGYQPQAPMYGGGGGGGGDSGGGGGGGDDLDGRDDEDPFPDDLDAEGDGTSDGGELGFDPNEPLPPPPPPKGSGARDGDGDDEFPEPPADDGSGHPHPAAAPDNGGQDPGGPVVDAGPGGDDDDDVYPGEGDPMGSAG